LAPMDADELRDMLRWAVNASGPIAIRYPRGGAVEEHRYITEGLTIMPKARIVNQGVKAAFLSIGTIGNAVQTAIDGLDIAHYDMRATKPLDTDTLDYVAAHFDTIFTAEDGILQGGFGSAVLEYLADKGYKGKVHRFGVDNQFVTHGKPEELYHLLHLDAEGIRDGVLNSLKDKE